jgi:hypothetical protein
MSADEPRSHLKGRLRATEFSLELPLMISGIANQRLKAVARIRPPTAVAMLAVIRRTQPRFEPKYQSTEASEALCVYGASLRSDRGRWHCEA